MVVDRLTLRQAATSPDALLVIFDGVVVVPVTIGYTECSYRVLWGKSTDFRC